MLLLVSISKFLRQSCEILSVTGHWRGAGIVSALGLQHTFRSSIFFKFRFFGQSKDPNEISNVKKKSLQKIKYWQRNDCSRINWSGHCNKLKLIGNLSDCSQSLTVCRITQTTKTCLRIFSFEILFYTPFFKIIFRKCSVTFHWNWKWQIADTFFRALGPETEGHIK